MWQKKNSDLQNGPKRLVFSRDWSPFLGVWFLLLQKKCFFATVTLADAWRRTPRFFTFDLHTNGSWVANSWVRARGSASTMEFSNRTLGRCTGGLARPQTWQRQRQRPGSRNGAATMTAPAWNAGSKGEWIQSMPGLAFIVQDAQLNAKIAKKQDLLVFQAVFGHPKTQLFEALGGWIDKGQGAAQLPETPRPGRASALASFFGFGGNKRRRWWMWLWERDDGG